MPKVIDVCRIYIGKPLKFLRIRMNGDVIKIKEIYDHEYNKINALLIGNGYSPKLTTIQGLPSLCLTYHDVNDEIIEKILEYGEDVD